MVGKMKVRFEILSKLYPFGGTCQFSWLGTAFLLSQSLNAQKLRSGLQSDLPGGGNSCYIDFFSCWSSLFFNNGTNEFLSARGSLMISMISWFLMLNGFDDHSFSTLIHATNLFEKIGNAKCCNTWMDHFKYVILDLNFQYGGSLRFGWWAIVSDRWWS